MNDRRRSAKACRQMALTVVDQKSRDALLETAAILEEGATEEEAMEEIAQSSKDNERK
jgi:hypothetical protein